MKHAARRHPRWALTWTLTAGLMACGGAPSASFAQAQATAHADGERIPPGEAEATAEVTRLLAATVQRGFDHEGRAFRDAHRKAQPPKSPACWRPRCSADSTTRAARFAMPIAKRMAACERSSPCCLTYPHHWLMGCLPNRADTTPWFASRTDRARTRTTMRAMPVAWR